MCDLLCAVTQLSHLRSPHHMASGSSPSCASPAPSLPSSSAQRQTSNKQYQQTKIRDKHLEEQRAEVRRIQNAQQQRRALELIYEKPANVASPVQQRAVEATGSVTTKMRPSSASGLLQRVVKPRGQSADLGCIAAETTEFSLLHPQGQGQLGVLLKKTEERGQEQAQLEKKEERGQEQAQLEKKEERGSSERSHQPLTKRTSNDAILSEKRGHVTDPQCVAVGLTSTIRAPTKDELFNCSRRHISLDEAASNRALHGTRPLYVDIDTTTASIHIPLLFQVRFEQQGGVEQGGV